MRVYGRFSCCEKESMCFRIRFYRLWKYTKSTLWVWNQTMLRAKKQLRQTNYFVKEMAVLNSKREIVSKTLLVKLVSTQTFPMYIIHFLISINKYAKIFEKCWHIFLLQWHYKWRRRFYGIYMETLLAQVTSAQCIAITKSTISRPALSSAYLLIWKSVRGKESGTTMGLWSMHTIPNSVTRRNCMGNINVGDNQNFLKMGEWGTGEDHSQGWERAKSVDISSTVFNLCNLSETLYFEEKILWKVMVQQVKEENCAVSAK